MVDKLNDVISKVQKLLRVAASSDKPGEVASAQSLASLLISRYQIEEAQLHGHIGEGDIISKRIDNPSPYALDKSILLNSIAKHNFCKVLRGDGYCMIYGYKSDIELCIALYDILLPHMVSEMLSKLDKRKKSAVSKVHPKAWAKSFFSGYCINISERIKESKQQVIKESAGTSIELVIRDKQHAVEEYFQEIEHRPASKRKINPSIGYMAGVDSSNNADLNQTKIEG